MPDPTNPQPHLTAVPKDIPEFVSSMMLEMSANRPLEALTIAIHALAYLVVWCHKEGTLDTATEQVINNLREAIAAHVLEEATKEKPDVVN